MKAIEDLECSLRIATDFSTSTGANRVAMSAKSTRMAMTDEIGVRADYVARRALRDPGYPEDVMNIVMCDVAVALVDGYFIDLSLAAP